MEHYTQRDQIAEVVNKLFIYTDEKQWQKLVEEIFIENVLFDMSSMGAGEAKILPSTEICAMWEKGFEGIDFVNHLSGNHLITINGERANVFAYATASHYKHAATLGKTREFVGTYHLHLVLSKQSWKIDSFKYNLKYSTGNLTLT